MQYRYRINIPIIGGKPRNRLPHVPAAQGKSPLAHGLRGTLTRSDSRRVIEETFRKTRHMTVLKPQGWLGAPWIDEFVSRKKGVNLCELCVRKYWKWWEKYDYRPIWSPKKLTDCDGCRSSMIHCSSFYYWKTQTPWAISVH